MLLIIIIYNLNINNNFLINETLSNLNIIIDIYILITFTFLYF